MFCKLCGKEIPDGKDTCDECAANSVNENNTNQNNQSTQTATVINNNQTSNNNPQQKSKLCAGLLGIFLGAFGVHNFYLGFYGKAIAQLLITVLSCCTLAIISEIWGLIEGIMLLCGSITTDANGVNLKD